MGDLGNLFLVRKEILDPDCNNLEVPGNFAFLNNPKVAAKMRLTACWEKHEGGRNLYGVANGNAEILNEEIVTATKKNVGGIRAPARSPISSDVGGRQMLLCRPSALALWNAIGLPQQCYVEDMKTVRGHRLNATAVSEEHAVRPFMAAQQSIKKFMHEHHVTS
eukprot:1154413-Pelagomonas_calceolata.AAC.1